jgi:hypothetical protein
MSRADSKPYSSAHIENIRRMLVNSEEAGAPLYFEFKVDGMVYIPHTNRVSAFDEHYDYINDNVESIEFIIFSASPTDKNRKSYLFHLKEKKQELNGLDIKGQVEEQMERFKDKAAIQQLERELREKENTILQQDEWIAEIQERVRDMQANPNHLGKIDLAKFAGSVLEGFVRRNPKVLSKVPGLEGIAEAFIEEESQTKTLAPPDRKVSFEVSEEGTQNALSEEDKFHISYGRKLSSALDEPQLELLFAINDSLIKEPSELKPVAELLNVSLE